MLVSSAIAFGHYRNSNAVLYAGIGPHTFGVSIWPIPHKGSFAFCPDAKRIVLKLVSYFCGRNGSDPSPGTL
jgi:hypothetical protein